MADRYVRKGYLRDGSELADALREVPRELFMPERHREASYVDDAFPIPPFSSKDQTISAPYTYPLFYSRWNSRRGISSSRLGLGPGTGPLSPRK